MTNLTSLISHLILKDSSKRMKILDLGSGLVNKKMEELLKKYRNSFNYTAVDMKTPYSIFSLETNDNIKSLEKVTTGDWITKINNSFRYFEDINVKAINETEFNEMFHFEFGKDAFEYCKENEFKEKYDIVIISNLLHFLDLKIAEELTRLCISMLNENGIIYICVFNSEQTSYKVRNPYSRLKFDSLKKGLQVIEEIYNAPLHHELLGKKISDYNSG